MLTLIAALVTSQPLLFLNQDELSSGTRRPDALRTYRNDGRVFRNEDPATVAGSAVVPLFEFAPADGGGMGAACACAAVTGSQGEVITTTRSGDAVCSKRGLSLTGYTPGDLVICGANLPRVEPDDAGVLGLRLEYQPRNELQYSSQFNASSWQFSTVNRFDAGLMTPLNEANGFTIQDASGATRAALRQYQLLTTNGRYTGSCFVRGRSLTALGLNVSTTGGSGSATCEYTGLSTTEWTRAACSVTTSGSHTAVNLFIYMGAVVGDQGTIDVTGCQLQSGSLSSYIPTQASAVQLGFETDTTPTPAGYTGKGCVKFTYSPQFTGGDTTGAYLVTGGTDRWAYRPGTGQGLTMYNGTQEEGITGTLVYDTPISAVIKHGATTVDLVWGASSGTVTYTAPTPGTTLYIGAHASPASANGIINRVLIDPAHSWCN